MYPAHSFKDIPFYQPGFLQRGKSSPAKQRKVSAISNGLFLESGIIDSKEIQEFYDHFFQCIIQIRGYFKGIKFIKSIPPVAEISQRFDLYGVQVNILWSDSSLER